MIIDKHAELRRELSNPAIGSNHHMRKLALALLDELEAAEKRIAELEASHNNLRKAIAGIHNTITGGGTYTPLAAILIASKRAYEESAAAAGKGE